MCGGCLKSESVIGLSNTKRIDGNTCAGITVDLLQMMLRPIQCYLDNKLWDQISSTKAELEEYKNYLELYIAAKIADPETCEYREQLPPVQVYFNKILVKGMCL